MQTYLNKGKELIKLLLNNGYEAYFVGEVVRNVLLGVKYKQVDIITNADLQTLRRVFKTPNVHIFDGDIEILDQHTFKIVYSEYVFYFHQFVNNEINMISDNRTAFSKHYSKNLLDDLATKNFTINAIAMSYSGKLTDADEGVNDINNRKIRTVGSPKQKFTDAPIEILNALVIASELKFRISDKTYSMMKKKAKLLTKVSLDEKVEKINEILENDYTKYALRLLVKSGVYKYIDSLSRGLCRIANKYRRISFEELLLISFVLNKQIDEQYNSYIENIETFKRIYNLALSNPKAKYDALTLFTNGLDVCLEANFINYILGKSRLKTKAIKKAYDLLLIKKKSDLKFKYEDVMRISEINDAKVIASITDEVCVEILNGIIRNDYEEIQDVVLRLLTEKGILYDLDKKTVNKPLVNDNFIDEEAVLKKTFNTDYNSSFHEVNYGDSSKILSEDEQMISDQIADSMQEDSYTNHRLRILEERLDEQDRLLREKNAKLEEMQYQKVLEASSKIINTTVDLIKRDSQVNSVIKNTDNFELELRSFIMEYLERENEDEKD